MAFGDFLVAVPPSQQRKVSIEIESRTIAHAPIKRYVKAPELQLYCEHCDGSRYFRAAGAMEAVADRPEHGYVTYTCANCRRTTKTYSLMIWCDADLKQARIYKYGERPAFGPFTPARLISLIGPDKDMFLKGRRCESQGLGVGAFAYYRQVVENQKNRILEEIIRVSKQLSVPAENVRALEDAKEETQFSKAMDAIKTALPESLLIKGRNPLTLLHSALSDGLHNRDDGHCLELATSIRVVLAELSERMSLALKDDTELNQAVSRLANLKPRS
jgi:hypothetical protein